MNTQDVLRAIKWVVVGFIFAAGIWALVVVVLTTTYDGYAEWAERLIHVIIDGLCDWHRIVVDAW